MWFDSKDNPNSMEAIIAKQLCLDPAQVYEDEHWEPSIKEPDQNTTNLVTPVNNTNTTEPRVIYVEKEVAVEAGFFAKWMPTIYLSFIVLIIIFGCAYYLIFNKVGRQEP